MQFITKLTLLGKLRYLTILSVLISGCSNKPGEDATVSDFAPLLVPDYSGITIPPNVAPLEFYYRRKRNSLFHKILGPKRRGYRTYIR